MAINVNKQIMVRGDTARLLFPYAGTASSVTFTAKLGRDILFQKILGDGVTLVSGGIQTVIQSFDTLGLPCAVTALLYDVQVIESVTGDTITVASGPLMVFPDVTD